MQRIAVRAGMFETNSSSMHSICLANSKANKGDNSYNTEDARIQALGPYIRGFDDFGYLECRLRIDLVSTMDAHDYGWGLEILKTPIDKLGYVYSSLLAESSRKYQYEELVYDAIGLDYFNGFIVPDPIQYVDHQSACMLGEYLGQSNNPVETLRELIFDDHYFILICSDNDGWVSEGEELNNDEDNDTVTEECGSWNIVYV